MHKKQLHIVSFDVPFPANYGGVIDVFYKIKSMHQERVGVILHCFQYGREKSEELESICEKVYYYKRKMNWLGFFSKTPFIVYSRKNKELFKNLMKDDFPIIFEGIHTTASISKINKKRTFIRSHNIEWEYYKNLLISEKNLFKKFFFWVEHIKLKLYETKIYKDQNALAISEKDQEWLINNGANAVLVNPFHRNESIKILKKTDDYVLYHGNFNVRDNEDAAMYFIELFKFLPIKLKIAGLNPSKKMKSSAFGCNNITVIDSPQDQKMIQLIRDARLNLFYSTHSSGVKLKLINALFNAQRCLVSHEYLVNSDLSLMCISVDEDNWKGKIEEEFNRNFNIEMIKNREEILNNYTCSFNINKVFRFIFQ